VPTLISQGTNDVLFGLDAGIANFEAIRGGGAPVKMIWHCGGHGHCPSAQAAYGLHLTLAALAWLKRWLWRDQAVDTGPLLEWQDDSGTWRSSAAFPFAPVGSLDAAGSGTLTISPLDSALGGAFLDPAPAVNAVQASFPAPPDDSTIVGAPLLKLTYHGIAVPSRTYLYAQVVDAVRGRVLGAQVTPLRVILDGRTRTIERPLETIAAYGGSGSRYRLQLAGATSVFSPQRSVGSVIVDRLSGSLPLVAASDLHAGILARGKPWRRAVGRHATRHRR
jgi:ABC-2 type transport system ATP-binding protein